RRRRGQLQPPPRPHCHHGFPHRRLTLPTEEFHMPQPPATYRTMVLVDAVGFTQPDRTVIHQVAVRSGLSAALNRAFTEAGVDWGACYHEARRDGMIVLVPADVPANVLAGRMLERLVPAVQEHNAVHVVEASIRLRVVLLSGQVRFEAEGAAGG